jgi:hypothetical protein
VSERDAFNREMGILGRLSDEQQERLLAGAPFADGGELDELASFMRAVPAFVREGPSEVLVTALVPRLADAARTSVPATETRRAPRRARLRRPRSLSRRALVARVAVAVALLPASMAALAVAGVKVPAPARDAFEGLGVELPNQKSDEDSAPAVEPSDVDETDATHNGRGKGNAPGKPAKRGKGKALGHQKAPGQGGTPPGKARGHDKAKSGQGGGSSKGKGNSSRGSTPPGRAKKESRPVPPGKAKGKSK